MEPQPSSTPTAGQGPLKHRLYLLWLGEEMGRAQGKNTLNNRKSNTAPPETITARPEHPKADEAEENNRKNNFMKMTEALRKEMRNSLKDVQEKTNKILEESDMTPTQNLST